MNLIKISNNMETEYTKYSKEELHEMINQTIVDGGDKITAHMLNLLLNHMVEGAGSGSGGGTGASAAQVFVNDPLSSEEQSNNISIFEQCKQSYESGTPMPLITIDLSAMYDSLLGQPCMSKMVYVASMVMYVSPGSPLESAFGGSGVMIGVYLDGEKLTFFLKEDGTVVTE